MASVDAVAYLEGFQGSLALGAHTLVSSMFCHRWWQVTSKAAKKDTIASSLLTVLS